MGLWLDTQEDASEFFTTLIESMAKTINANNQNCINNPNTFLDEIFSYQFRSRSKLFSYRSLHIDLK